MTFKLRKFLALVLSAALLTLTGTATVFAGNAPSQAGTAALILLGDSDGDGLVSIKDVTNIQRFIAKLSVSSGFNEKAADADGSGKLEIKDATLIQMKIANIAIQYPVGERIEVTVETTAEPTTAPITQMPTDPDGWGREIFKP